MARNRLIHEKSPYLLQHAHNPVDWQPWSRDAFERARAENRPVFVSIGYATCHWCHVMEKESFEDEEAARYLNDTFVCIKVDREERPDIDAVYMAACQMMTGSGGWPLSIFMTPDKKPFFAATYIPKTGRFGRPGLIDICRQVRELWKNRKDKLDASAQEIASHLSRAFAFSGADAPDESLLDRALQQIKRAFDPQRGGFESAPKFPTPHRLLFLLRAFHRSGDQDALDMVTRTLTAMRMGGIWDHVGFGFHRYSTDANWLLPHFEKMLYDQALIAAACLETFQATRDPLPAQTAEEIFTYVLRDMTSPDGAFYSAEDADSEGKEGRFYVWTAEAFKRVLADEDTKRWAAILRVSPEGNFQDEASHRRTGANILHLTVSLNKWADKLGLPRDRLAEEWERVREKLFQARRERAFPLKDDKILTDWNGLMIAALSQAARVLNRPDYAEAARRAARFVLSHMRDEKGRLYHRFRDGELAVEAQAADYAFLIHGLLNLYGATFDIAFAEEARALQRDMIRDFWDEKDGGFFSTRQGADELPVRPKELYDGALPSANSAALNNLLVLSRLTGDATWEDKAHELVRAFAGTVKAQPTAFTFFLCGLDSALRPGQEVVVSGSPEAADTRELLAALNLHYAPSQVTVVKSEQNAGRLARFAGYTDGLQVVADRAVAHVCRGGACTGSTSDSQTLLDQILGNKKT
ncbi:MAG: thioredoxin domain-containing protein [Thermodesulfobacteriota bacterium]